ncbi:hypothetical protein P691DRAFT_755954 [Macrolepiota fuliginosa MF-IS2]|uniref:Mitochondrial K+-H+ exchange-related-domain-containing protein n=1 Tax=Macrolepiota fuliginosa MF-IS2 TaxID=1400762 RepID=A0A9P6C8H5_9AGAR|nr:hypothetical protein P691DRAFT_755954 [Macrolepiota fuliginosa MF-IS2]
MSLTPRSLRKMRIISVPLTRPRPPAHRTTDTRQALTYYQFQITSSQHPPSENATEKKGAKSRWLPEEGIVKFLQGKAAATWTGFGKTEQGSWKLKVYQMGESLVDRMDFEELALKGLDPSLGPSLSHPSPEVEKPSRIPLIYPSSLSSDSESLLHLKKLVEHRMPRHRRGFYAWMIIAPFTAPFMIVPVIPNLPFFFCVWRSWSHYRAYRATQYLQDLLANGVIVPEGSEALDAIFKDFSPPSTPSEEESSNTVSKDARGHELLLRKEAVPTIVSLFGLKKSADADLYRAIEQARLRIENGRLKP